MPSPLEGVHPETHFRPTKSKAEARVWEALKKRLPAGWSAWHSLKLRDRKATFGEGDFVLAHPERGILILEVKGGQLEVCDGHWFQNGRPLEEAPLDQAHGYRGLLLSRFRSRNLYAPSIGQAPCFPDTVADNQPSQDDVRGLVVTGHHLHWLDQALPAIADKAIPPPRRCSPGWLEALHDMWGETWAPALSLGGLAKEAAARRLELDEAQLEALEGLLENKRVLIQGGAGSGKTLLAAEASRRLAADGRKVLLLCFTAPLRKWLAARLEGSGIEVHTISGLARRMENQAGRAPPPGSLPEVDGWRHAFVTATELCEPRWDAVVVDEGQDLQVEAWAFAAALSKGKRLWAFHDPGQGYWPDRTPPREQFGSTYRLPKQQRCPAGVQALANRALGLGNDEAAIAAAHADGTIGPVVVTEGQPVHDAVGAEIDRLLAAGLTLADIGVVSLRGRAAGGGDSPAPTYGKHTSVRADAEDAEERLVSDTFLRWKGLERPAIIVTELPEEDLANLKVRLNVALTRATVAVRLVGSGAALGKIGFT
ncbi:MAG: NERD domain-containing protein/DEAD/DEAH box helicase [Anaeromyxobacteraceae bacterium]|nr:NERD domain-containing protein/DEAD/DEAH box helicase [Anaeromyxobacteraceae bacterium]